MEVEMQNVKITETQSTRPFKAVVWILYSVFVIYAVISPRIFAQIVAFRGNDKLLHFLAFFVLTVFFRKGYKRDDALSVLSFVLLTGGLIELLQLLTHARSPSIFDLISDLLGGGLAILVPVKAIDFVFLLISSFLGIGFIEYWPGTIASLIILVFYIVLPIKHTALLSYAIPLTIIGIVLGSYYYIVDNRGDPPWFVLDEVVGMIVALLLVPKSISAAISAFVLFRVFDIFKPFPIRAFDKIRNGWGVMGDDLFAGGMAGIVVIIIEILTKTGGIS